MYARIEIKTQKIGLFSVGEWSGVETWSVETRKATFKEKYHKKFQEKYKSNETYSNTSSI